MFKLIKFHTFSGSPVREVLGTPDKLGEYQVIKEGEYLDLAHLVFSEEKWQYQIYRNNDLPRRRKRWGKE